MTDSIPATAAVPDWTAMVLLSQQKRVRHLAVWSDVSQPPGPICRNRGDFPYYGRMDEFDGVPICTRCADEVHLLRLSIRNAE